MRSASEVGRSGLPVRRRCRPGRDRGGAPGPRQDHGAGLADSTRRSIRACASARSLITVRACVKRPPEEPPETAAFLEIDEARPGATPRRKRSSAAGCSPRARRSRRSRIRSTTSMCWTARATRRRRRRAARPENRPARRAPARAAGGSPRAGSRSRRSARRWPVTNWVSSSSKPPSRKPRDEMGERHLARIGHAAEHAFAEKGAAQRHAVEAADQFAVVAGLNAMREAMAMERGIEPHDLVVDPGLSGGRAPARRSRGSPRRNRWSRWTSRRSARIVRRSRRGRWKPSSGRMPRRSGSTQNSSGSSADSAIGKIPAA